MIADAFPRDQGILVIQVIGQHAHLVLVYVGEAVPQERQGEQDDGDGDRRADQRADGPLRRREQSRSLQGRHKSAPGFSPFAVRFAGGFRHPLNVTGFRCRWSRFVSHQQYLP